MASDDCAILVRVSTRDQTSGHSPRVQEQLAREYIAKCGGKWVKTYGGQESATREERPILDAALADAGVVYTDLVIRESTRLSRHTGVMLLVLERLAAAGVRLHDLHGPVDFASPHGEYRMVVESASGRLTARVGTEASIDARVDVMKRGGIAAGRPPWGRVWNDQKRAFTAIPKERDRMHRAFDLIVNRGKSVTAAAKLLKLGYSSLQKAIHQAAKRTTAQHLRGVRYEYRCEPLITAAQYSRLRRRIAENTVVRPSTSGVYLLQGLVRCAGCGAAMTGQTSSKSGYRYAIYRHARGALGENCVWGVPVDLLDDDVPDVCGWLVWSRQTLKNAIRASVAHERDESRELARHLKVIRREIADERKHADDLVNALVALPKNSDVRTRTQRRIEESERRLADKLKEARSMKTRLELCSLPTENADAIAQGLRSLFPFDNEDAARAASTHQKRAFVRALTGRSSSIADTGIFIYMFREPGAAKKSVRWSWELRGRFVHLQHYIGRNSDGIFDPAVLDLKDPDRAALASLGAAVRDAGRRTGQSITKSSSGG